jgi:hypothetical protein
VSNEVPVDPKVYNEDNWLAYGTRTSEARHILPFTVEQQLADDLAFIAASREGVKAVSAVGLEEIDEHCSLIVRLADGSGTNDDSLTRIPHACPCLPLLSP